MIECGNMKTCYVWERTGILLSDYVKFKIVVLGHDLLPWLNNISKRYFDFDSVRKTFLLNHMTWFKFFFKPCLSNPILVFIWIFLLKSTRISFLFLYLSTSPTLLTNSMGSKYCCDCEDISFILSMKEWNTSSCYINYFHL